MTMKLACADFSFLYASHDLALDIIAGLGLQGVDIGLFPGVTHFRHEHFLGSPAAAARGLAARVHDHGLEFADLFHQSGADLVELTENHPDPQRRREARELFARTLEFCVLLGCPHMTTLPGMRFEGESPEDSLNRSSEELAWRCERAADAGVEYSVEAHMWSVAPSPELAARLVAMTPGLKLTLDLGHYVAQGFGDDAIGLLMPHTSHFHARCASRELLQTGFETNAIPWRRVVQSMKANGYRGYLGLEYVVTAHDCIETVDNLTETIRLRDELLRLAAENE